jgi:methanogenic corrinoid protein MtbC1
MATVCLREDRWLVHHLAADLPADEVARMAAEVGASLVVLSACTADTAGAAQQAAEEIRAAAPGLHVLAGQPGDTLTQLRRLARAVADSSLRSVTSALAAWFAPGRGLGVGAGRC